MKTLTFNFKEYTPIEVNVKSEEDITNLNIILGYICHGAKIFYEGNEQYFMDMSFEDEDDLK